MGEAKAPPEDVNNIAGDSVPTGSLTTAERYRRAVAGRLRHQTGAEVEAARRQMLATTEHFFRSVSRAVDEGMAAFARLVHGQRRAYETFTDRLPAILTRACQEGFDEDNPPKVHAYLRLVLRGRPTPERIEALHIIVRRRRTAEVAARESGVGLIRYLRRSVALESRALAKDREARDRIWDYSLDILRESSGAVRHALGSRATGADPATLVIRKEQEVALLQIIVQYLNDPTRDPKQRTLLRLLLQDHIPAEAIRLCGGSWSTYQALQRALARRFRRTQIA